ncbi:unnamed protein product [Candidula unifasciata]|uniref:Monocarboxylate transporter n=1 Tax=Candidula unifasciata TaxID=100452 RepID=A0A8S4A1B9_9EUPU|nr:unnamed protein product [Candidula unifasciata]
MAMPRSNGAVGRNLVMETSDDVDSVQSGNSSKVVYTSRSAHPVDHGWAWVVMFGSFGVHFLSFGFIRSFGILFLEFQAKFEASSAMTAVVVGVQFCVYSISTFLVVNVVLKRFSVRQSCLLGCCLQSLGILLNGIVADIRYLLFTQGVLFGIGLALIYCPSLIIISQYFDSRRAISTAMAASGVSAGGVTLPFLMRYFVENYGLRGGLMLLSAVMFNQAVFVSLFTPPSQYTFVESGTSKKGHVSSDINMKEATRNDNEEGSLHREIPTSVHDRKLDESVESSSPLDPISNRSSDTNESKLKMSNQNKTKQFRERGNSATSQDMSLLQKDPLQAHSWKDSVLGVLPTSGTDLYGSLYDVSSQKIVPCARNQSPSNGRYELSDTDVDDGKNTKGKTRWRCRLPPVTRTLHFWILLVFFACGGTGSGLPPIFLPPLAKEKGMNDKASFLLMMSAATEVIGRLLPGVILHLGIMGPCTVLIAPLVACGTLYQFTALYDDFGSLLAMALLIGLFTGSFWTMQSLVVIDIYGLDKLGPMLGFYVLIVGLSLGASNPFSGLLRDLSGSYSVTFHFFGIVYYIAALMMVIVLVLKRISSKKRRDAAISDQNMQLMSTQDRV